MFEPGHTDIFDVESFLDTGNVNLEDIEPEKTLVDPIKRCPECDSTNIFHDIAETICRDCGIVIEDGLPERKPGYRVFGDAEKDLNRIHAEKVKIGRSMTTTMGYPGHGGSLSPEATVKMAHLKKWDYRLKMTKEERVINEAMNHVRLACSDLQLTEAIRESCILFFQKYVKNVLDGDLRSNGVRIEDLVSAVIFKTCKDRGVPYTIDEIAGVLKIDAAKIRASYLDILRSLDRNQRTIQTPVDYIPRVASSIHVGTDVSAVAIRIMTDAMKCDDFKRISMGKNAMGFATAAAYLACLLKGVMPQRTREIVASYTNIADTTIKKRAEEIIMLLKMEAEVRDAYDKHYKSKEKETVNRLKNY